MGRAMGFGSEPTFSTHVVRQQRMRPRARWGGAGVELWKNVIVVETWNNNVLGLYAEVQDDAGRAPVWEEGERVSYKHWR